MSVAGLHERGDESCLYGEGVGLPISFNNVLVVSESAPRNTLKIGTWLNPQCGRKCRSNNG